MPQPNVVFLLTDQWRLQALGYAGNKQVRTPNIDRLAHESVNFKQAISGYSVCCPWRASFLTGQYPLTHGVIVNDVPISSEPVGLGDAFKQAGYNTAFIGKWHVDGQGRSKLHPARTPPRLRRLHGAGMQPTITISRPISMAMTRPCATGMVTMSSRRRPPPSATSNHKTANSRSCWCLAGGPPHNPYQTAPPEYRDMYDPRDIVLRPNVPADMADEAREWLAGYYAHCSAIDKSAGDIMATLDELGLTDDTVLVFASDHGDMLGSQGTVRKQKPWEESIRVPFLLRYPAEFGRESAEVDSFLNAHDIMPTLLGVCGLPIPATVEGRDFSPALRGEKIQSDGALLACFHPFGEWHRGVGGREYRGIRTARYSYCRALDGPWLLYDNEADPFQLTNLVDRPECAEAQRELDALLGRELEAIGDDFLPGMAYIERWGYPLDDTGTVPFR